jgi:hypothetical protein
MFNIEKIDPNLFKYCDFCNMEVAKAKVDSYICATCRYDMLYKAVQVIIDKNIDGCERNLARIHCAHRLNVLFLFSLIIIGICLVIIYYV